MASLHVFALLLYLSKVTCGAAALETIEHAHMRRERRPLGANSGKQLLGTSMLVDAGSKHERHRHSHEKKQAVYKTRGEFNRTDASGLNIIESLEYAIASGQADVRAHFADVDDSAADFGQDAADPKRKHADASNPDADEKEKAIALCLTGHVRTFVLPGVYSAFARNTLYVDVFFVGHLGAAANSSGWKHPELDDFKKQHQVEMTADAVDHALSLLGTRLKHKELHEESNCKAMQKAWANDNITGRKCVEKSHFLQIMWLDHCIRQVQKSSTSYDIIARSRPDVGLFSPVGFPLMTGKAVEFMAKDTQGKADFFFTMPTKVIKGYWNIVVDHYLNEDPTGVPDYTIFERRFLPYFKETEFPAAIVRGADFVECHRLVGPRARSLRRDCEEKAARGYFGNVDHSSLEQTVASDLSNAASASMIFPPRSFDFYRVLLVFGIAVGLAALGCAKSASPAMVLSCAISAGYVALSVSIDLLIADQKENELNQFAFNPICAVILTEALKFKASATMYIGSRLLSEDPPVAAASLSGIILLLLPAVLYTASNILIYKALEANDPAAFAVFRDTVILWTACMWRCIYRTPLGHVRLLGISLVCGGLVLNRLMHLVVEGETFTWKFLWVLLMAVVNASAAVSNEFALKWSPAFDINIQNMVMCISCICLSTAALLVMDPLRLAGTANFFQGFSQLTFLMISMQATVGLLVSRLFKYADAVTKTMASCLRGPTLVLLAPYFVSSPRSLSVIASAGVVSVGAMMYLSQGLLVVSSRRADELSQKTIGS